MSMVDTVERRLVGLKSAEAQLRAELSTHEATAAKKRTEANNKRDAARRTTSATSQKTYLNSALKLEEDAAVLDKKGAAVSKKLADNAESQRRERSALERAEKTAAAARDRDDERRRQKDKSHAREVARLATPSVRYVHEVRHIPTPAREQLRILYLTANPRVVVERPDGTFDVTRIRVDAEVRDVRAEVRAATHRDSVDIDVWPAATPLDLLSGLNEKRPHVVHFSGHGGGRTLEFDDGEVSDPSGVPIGFELLARGLASTDSRPALLVLNACDTLDGAEVLLAAVPVVVATASSITDTAATVFAAKFYGAIASGQSVRAALDQARYALEVVSSGAEDVIRSVTREDVDLDELILVVGPGTQEGGW